MELTWNKRVKYGCDRTRRDFTPLFHPMQPNMQVLVRNPKPSPWVLFPSQKPPPRPFPRSMQPRIPLWRAAEVPHAQPPEVTQTSQVSCHCLGSSVLALQETHPSDSHLAVLWDTRTAGRDGMKRTCNRGDTTTTSGGRWTPLHTQQSQSPG